MKTTAPTTEQLKGNGQALDTLQVIIKNSTAEDPTALVTINAHEYDPDLHELPGVDKTEDDKTEDDPRDSMSASELRAYLKENGVEFEHNANKTKLLELAKGVQ